MRSHIAAENHIDSADGTNPDRHPVTFIRGYHTYSRNYLIVDDKLNKINLLLATNADYYKCTFLVGRIKEGWERGGG